MFIRKLKIAFPNAKIGMMETIELAFPEGDVLEAFVAQVKDIPGAEQIIFHTPWTEVVHADTDSAGMFLAKAMARGLE